MEGFQWDSDNVLHIARHDVSKEEVEEVICGDALELDMQSQDGEERFPLIGETARGRVLFCGLRNPRRFVATSYRISAWCVSNAPLS